MTQEERKEYNRKYYLKKKEQIKQNRKQRYRANPVPEKNYQKRNYTDNLERCRAYYHNNKSRPNIRFAYLKAASKRRKIEIQMTLEEYTKILSKENCFYCNSNVVEDSNNGSCLDRLDSTRPYCVDNVVLCCGKCNRIKSNIFTKDQMLKIGKLIEKEKMYEKPETK